MRTYRLWHIVEKLNKFCYFLNFIKMYLLISFTSRTRFYALRIVVPTVRKKKKNSRRCIQPHGYSLMTTSVTYTQLLCNKKVAENVSKMHDRQKKNKNGS